MSDDKTFLLTTTPGISRDGTMLDGNNYIDGQWVRFLRREGRAKKMGGMRAVSSDFTGPSRGAFGWSRNGLLSLHSFGNGTIEQSYIDAAGSGGAVTDRSGNGSIFYTGGDHRSDIGDDIVWQIDAMYDAAAGSDRTLIIAHPGGNLVNIDNDLETSIYFGVANDTTPFERLTSTRVSGGVVALSPYLVVYGSDGLVSWSNANEPLNLDIRSLEGNQFGDGESVPPGDRGTARITGSKIVKGLPLRGSGQSPAALLWSLDSVFRMYYIGGAAVFKFDPVSSQSSVLSSSGFIEYDGKFFWAGVDRFLMYNGAVQELPNEYSQNWFFDNLNFAQRQKVWVTKNTKYGEIWWHFPFGEATECTHALIYNVRLNVWYDTELGRTSGIFPQVFHRPIWFETSDTKAKAWIHEEGKDQVEGETALAIPSFFETSEFGFPTGGSDSDKAVGANRWTRVTRIEPDFVMSGDMTVEVVGRDFAQASDITSEQFIFNENTGKIDMREQRREIRLKFTSNTLGGDYESGKILMHLDVGDVRS